MKLLTQETIFYRIYSKFLVRGYPNECVITDFSFFLVAVLGLKDSCFYNAGFLSVYQLCSCESIAIIMVFNNYSASYIIFLFYVSILSLFVYYPIGSIFFNLSYFILVSFISRNLQISWFCYHSFQGTLRCLINVPSPLIIFLIFFQPPDSY